MIYRTVPFPMTWTLDLGHRFLTTCIHIRYGNWSGLPAPVAGRVGSRISRPVLSLIHIDVHISYRWSPYPVVTLEHKCRLGESYYQEMEHPEAYFCASMLAAYNLKIKDI